MCVEKAEELLDDDSKNMTKDMTIDEWLHRMNMLHLKKHFE